MSDLDNIIIESYINKALLKKSLGNEEFFNYIVEILNPDIEKSKEGFYKDNWQNRKLGIVGLPYKRKKKDELPELKNQTSEDLYKEQGVWNRSRRINIHEKIKESYRKKMYFERKPRAYLMLGGGGSGKGFYLDKIKNEDKSLQNLPVLDIDEIRTSNQMPDYHRVWKIDKKLAANYVHNEVSELGSVIQDEYINQRSSFVRDAVFGNYSKLEELVKRLKNQGYEVHLIGVATDYDLALKRIQKRFETKGRWLDPEVAKKGHKGASDSFARVIFGPLRKDFSEIKLYDGNTDKGLIYDNKIINERELERFLKKRTL